MEVVIDIQSRLTQEMLIALANKKTFRKELTDSAIVVLRSIDKNFLEGGRPDEWEESFAAKKRRDTFGNSMTLVDTGRLRRSSTIIGDPENIHKIYNQDTILTLSTRVPYAVYLHDERPWMMIQDEDIDPILDIFQRGILRVI